MSVSFFTQVYQYTEMVTVIYDIQKMLQSINRTNNQSLKIVQLKSVCQLYWPCFCNSYASGSASGISTNRSFYCGTPKKNHARLPCLLCGLHRVWNLLPTTPICAFDSLLSWRSRLKTFLTSFRALLIHLSQSVRKSCVQHIFKAFKMCYILKVLIFTYMHTYMHLYMHTYVCAS